MAKITAFQVGYCTHPACMALKGGGLRSRCFPSRAYLIETRRGLHLWDTGYAHHFIDAAKGIYRLYPLVTPVHFDEQESLLPQLKRVGVGQRDISSIIVSHFHADHMAGLRDFPDTKIVCHAQAWESIQGLTGIRALLNGFLPGLVHDGVINHMTFLHHLPEIKLPPELLPFESGWDVAGTGEVIVVPLPGHAKGHIGAFVQQESGWTLLASDSAWSPESYTQLRGPSELTFLIQDSRAQYYNTLHKLHLLHSSGKADIQLTHQYPG